MSEGNEVIRCSKCGTENSKENKFCQECGSNLKEEILNNTSLGTNSRLGNLILTNDAITQSTSVIGKEFFMHIFLKDISSIKLGYRSFPILIILAIISLIVACCNLSNYDISIPVIAGILFFVFLGIFFATRTHTLIITARGGERMLTKVKAGDNAKEFVDKLINAKQRV